MIIINTQFLSGYVFMMIEKVTVWDTAVRALV